MQKKKLKVICKGKSVKELAALGVCCKGKPAGAK
jgi:hypothetical protein